MFYVSIDMIVHKTLQDWTRLIVPALLVGIFGYAIATPIGLLIGPFLAKVYINK